MKLNTNQKIVLALGVLTFGGLGCFPPTLTGRWALMNGDLFDRHVAALSPREINYAALLILWFVALAVTGAVAFLLADD